MATFTDRIRYVFEGSSSKLTTASRQAAGSLFLVDNAASRATRSLSGTGEAAKGLERVAQGVGGRVGEMAGRVSALGSGLGALGPVLGAATLGTVALGVASVGAFKAIELGVSVAYDMVTAFTAAHEAGLTLGTDVGDRMDLMSESLNAVRVAGGLLVADVVTDWQPIVTEFAIVAATATLELRDAWNDLIGVAPTLRDNIIGIARFAWLPYGKIVQQVIDSQLRLAAMFGVELPSSFRRLSNQAGQLDTIIADDLLPALGEFAESQGFNADRGRQLVASLRDTGDAARRAAVDFDAMNRSAEGAANATARLSKGPLEEAKKSFDFDKTAVLAAEALQQQKQAMEDVADVAKSNYAPALNAISGIFRDLPGLFKEGTLAAFVATKASALGQSIVNGALAVTNVLANVPAPFNIPLAATVGGLAAAQTGIIAAQKPQSFDIGGVVTGGPRVPGGNNRQVYAQLEVGERVQTVEQQRQEAMGGTVVVPIVVSRREKERFVLSTARAGGLVSRLKRRRGRGQRRFSGV